MEGLNQFFKIEELKEFFEPVIKICNAILNPIDTLTMGIEWVLQFIPAVLCLMIIFYAVTKSRKILKTLGFTTLLYLLLKGAFVFNMGYFIIVIVITVVLIRFIGVIM